MANVKYKKQYLIAVFVMLVFVLNDLIFDFLFSFNGSNYIAFACTLTSSIIVFIYTYKVKSNKILDEFDSTTKFIKSNFDNWQVVFSILDIICGIISILSGIAILSIVFKSIKFGYVPVKIAVVANKEKSIIKGVIKFSQGWSLWRLLTSKGDKSVMKKILSFLKRNKLTLLCCLVGGGLTAYAGYEHSSKFLHLAPWGSILISALSAIVVIAILYLLGGETAKQFVLRIAGKRLDKENYDKVEQLIVACEKEQVEKKEQDKLSAKLVKEAELKAQEELKAKQDAELKALTQKKLEELKIKQINETNKQ